MSDAFTVTPIGHVRGGRGAVEDDAWGAVEAIFCVLATRDGRMPPTLNLAQPDPACPLAHIIGGALTAPVRHALTNAFGFGGSNGTLVISRVDAAGDRA